MSTPSDGDRDRPDDGPGAGSGSAWDGPTERAGSQPPSWDAPGGTTPYGQPPAGSGSSATGQGAGPAGPPGQSGYGAPPYGAPGSYPGQGQPQGPPQQYYGAPPPGYGQQQWAQPGWGPPPGYGGYPAAQETDGKAIVALVLAIASFVVCPLVPAIVALVLASGSQRDIEASGGRLTGMGLVKAAKITSWVNIVLCVVGGIALIALIAAAPDAFETTTTYLWR